MKHLTTGDMAKITTLAPRTIAQFVDRGELEGFRIPGSQDRRIPKRNAVRFLRTHGMPLNSLDDPDCIVLVSSDEALCITLQQKFLNGVHVHLVRNSLDAADVMHSLHPGVIIVDFATNAKAAQVICTSLQRAYLRTCPEAALIVLDQEFGSCERFMRPFDADLLHHRICRYIFDTVE